MNRKITYVLILIGIVFFGGLSILTFFEVIDNNIAEKGIFELGFSISHFINPEYEYAPPIIRQKDMIEIPIILKFQNGTTKNTTFGITGNTELVFKSTALSSQNPIKVNATVSFPWIEQEWRRLLEKESGDTLEDMYILIEGAVIMSEEDLWNRLDNQYFLVFPFAQNYPRDPTSNTYFSAMFPIEKNIKTKQYLGAEIIMYPFHGEIPFFELFTQDELQQITEGTTAYVAGSSIDETIQGKPLLIIEPSSVTTVLRTNILIIALTSAVIAFMIAQLGFHLLKQDFIQVRGKQDRLGEPRDLENPKINEKFSNTKWKKFVVTFWFLMIALVLAFIGASWNSPESTTQKIGAITSVLALFFAVYIAVWTAKTEYLKKQEIMKKTNHAKEEIYSTLRAIVETRKQRERIRTMNPLSLADVDLKTEILFMNHKLKRVIESLQFVLSINSEYLPSKFVSRVNDAINGYDFILGRLDIFPLENDDPKNVLAGDNEGFIQELKAI